jgi:hypothetical protein
MPKEALVLGDEVELLVIKALVKTPIFAINIVVTDTFYIDVHTIRVTAGVQGSSSGCCIPQTSPVPAAVWTVDVHQVYEPLYAK